ncbi:MAG: GNAT family N-acetyltransferase [Chloroflexi bacterium]|nr:GNAT family N-acetyltransferase [Chloroflexota bacterium]
MNSNTKPGNDISVRLAREADRRQLATLIDFGTYVHQHLDWRTPLDWVGHQPYLVAERDCCLVAAMACPPDLPDMAWIRLFATSPDVSVRYAWESLWAAARDQLAGTNICVAAMPHQSWFRKLLEATAFVYLCDVVMLEWVANGQPPAHCHSTCSIRPMEIYDLPAVQAVDAESFSPIWQNSAALLKIAVERAAIATVAEDESGIIGYQISTASAACGHLARLAVHPRLQSRGVGYALVQDLLAQFRRWGALKVTVNTQTDNQASLSLYKEADFQRTDRIYPVYQTYL